MDNARYVHFVSSGYASRPDHAIPIIHFFILLSLSAELFSLDDIPELTGTLVTEFGLLTNLETLQIMHAPINGPLPTELGGLTALKTMGLSFLELESTLPVEYANIATLERMDFNINYGLVGTIPTEYGNLVNLSEYCLRCNHQSHIVFVLSTAIHLTSHCRCRLLNSRAL